MEGTEGIWDSVLTGQGLMLLVTIIIFIATLFLVFRGLIGFVITAVMIFIACITGLMILNNDITQRIFHYERNVLPENRKISLESIKQSITDVYEMIRKGVCTETVKIVYDPKAVDNIDEVIFRLQRQQDELQSVIKNLRETSSSRSTVSSSQNEFSARIGR